ncbi:hypothetical protein SKAU_G00018620 [Synaphobranchus kaupii]|uniref:Uncharacterized protein n=1 Tax=Synaphobranchus kaupii TaxID=118154 RepID=A0A9Q1GCQ7_SYNKA|nr:hypothetical protein SKAU_G00018620 [Synaphobranchus kaupii]
MKLLHWTLLAFRLDTIYGQVGAYLPEQNMGRRDDEILIDSFVAACQTVDATGFNSPPPSPSHTEQLTADPGPKLGAQPKVRFCSTPASSEPWIIVRGEKKRDGNPSRNPSPGPIQLGNRFDVLGNSEQQLSAASLVPTTLIGPSLTEADPSPAANVTARPICRAIIHKA